jgi:hypothetical protein
VCGDERLHGFTLARMAVHVVDDEDELVRIRALHVVEP